MEISPTESLEFCPRNLKPEVSVPLSTVNSTVSDKTHAGNSLSRIIKGGLYDYATADIGAVDQNRNKA